jgi:carbon monoxide dehydrogenase subunit G
VLRVSVNRRCAAPPEKVWPWIADPHKHVQTLPDSVSKIEVSGEGDVACVVTAMGVSEPMIVRVVEADEPRRLVERRIDGGREATTIFEVEPDGAGSTVTLTSEIEVPRLIGGMVKGHVERGLREQLENLDRLSAGSDPG